MSEDKNTGSFQSFFQSISGIFGPVSTGINVIKGVILLFAVLFVWNVLSSIFGFFSFNISTMWKPSYETLEQRLEDATVEIDLLRNHMDIRKKTWGETLWSGEDAYQNRLHTADTILNGGLIHKSNPYVLFR